jgi:type IV pilus assembly protein PilC
LPAHSPEELDERLLRQGIALTSYKKRSIPLLARAIGIQKKGELFAHVAQLMRAGILLPDALEMAAQQSNHPLLHNIASTLSDDIKNGVPFDDALARHKKIAHPMISCMLTAGNEAGDVSKAFEHCAAYCTKQATFEKNVRAAVAMPSLTFLFFIGVSAFIFTMIIPRFADMFGSLQQELPLLTRRMIAISDFMRSSTMLLMIAVVTVVFFVLRYYSTRGAKKWYDATLLSVPFVGALVCQNHLQHVLHALALLTHNGVTSTKALALVTELETNHCIKKQLERMCHSISSGQLMGEAMADTGIFLPDAVAMIQVGEESGTVAQSIEYAVDLYRDTVDRSLRRLTLLIQPVIIVLLGLLITLVIFAVYLPIMELSRVI